MALSPTATLLCPPLDQTMLKCAAAGRRATGTAAAARNAKAAPICGSHVAAGAAAANRPAPPNAAARALPLRHSGIEPGVPLWGAGGEGVTPTVAKPQVSPSHVSSLSLSSVIGWRRGRNQK